VPAAVGRWEAAFKKLSVRSMHKKRGTVEWVPHMPLSWTKVKVGRTLQEESSYRSCSCQAFELTSITALLPIGMAYRLLVNTSNSFGFLSLI